MNKISFFLVKPGFPLFIISIIKWESLKLVENLKGQILSWKGTFSYWEDETVFPSSFCMWHACSKQTDLQRKLLPGYGFQFLCFYISTILLNPTSVFRRALLPVAAVGQRSGSGFRAIANLQADWTVQVKVFPQKSVDSYFPLRWLYLPAQR